MSFEEEMEIFKNHISLKNLKLSDQRIIILETFLAIEKHLTAEELYDEVKKETPSVGITTIYRTLKLLSECGLSREIKFYDGTTRYEHVYKHLHHDHLICIKCRKVEEVYSSHIEKIQLELAESKGFDLISHRLDLFGICKNCKL